VSSPTDEKQLTRKQRREQARTERKALEAAEQASTVRRKRLTMIGVPLGGLAIAAVVALIATSSGGKSTHVTGAGASAALQATPAPWAPQYAGLQTRLAALNLPSQSDGAYHVHAALRVYVNGKQIPVPAELIKRTTLGEFVWPTGLDKDTWRGYRTTPATIGRPLTDIAPEELINAMADTANTNYYDDEHELYRATMLVFGQRRLTSQTIARLTACRQLAEKRSRLIKTEHGDWRGGA
jgi:hypothetical protein